MTIWQTTKVVSFVLPAREAGLIEGLKLEMSLHIVLKRDHLETGVLEQETKSVAHKIEWGKGIL